MHSVTYCITWTFLKRLENGALKRLSVAERRIAMLLTHRQALSLALKILKIGPSSST
jgi:hypothetical protein